MKGIKSIISEVDEESKRTCLMLKFDPTKGMLENENEKQDAIY